MESVQHGVTYDFVTSLTTSGSNVSAGGGGGGSKYHIFPKKLFLSNWFLLRGAMFVLTFLCLFLNVITAVANLIAASATRLLGHL